MEKIETGARPALRLNYKRTFLIGFAFFGILLLWQVYDSWCPTILTELFARNIFGVEGGAALSEELSLEVQYLVGIMMAIDNLAALILLPIFGSLSDKTKSPIGKRMPYILAGTLVAAIAFPFIPLLFHYLPDQIGGLVGVILIMLVVIVAMMTYRSPAVSLMPDLTPKPLRSKANGIINIMGYLGGACATFMGMGFVLSDYVRDPESWCYQNIWAIELPFLIASLLMVVSAFVLFFKVKENKLAEELRPELEEGERLSMTAEKVDDDKPMAKANKVMLGLILGAEVCWFMADNAVNTFFSLFVQYYLNCSTSSSSLLTILGGVFSVLGFWFGGVIADRIGRKWTISIGLGLYIAGAILMCFAWPTEGADGAYVLPWILYLVFPIKGFGIALVNTCSFPMVVELCSSKKVGKFTSYYYAASMGAQAVTSIALGGLLYLTKSYSTLPIYATCFMAAAFLIFLFVRNIKAKVVRTKRGLEALDQD